MVHLSLTLAIDPHPQQMKLLIGKLSPSKGTIERHSRLRIGYFDQHSVEQLSAAETAKSSPVEHFIETMRQTHGIDLNEHTVRGVLGSFGLGARRSTDPIGTLSGGQKVGLNSLLRHTVAYFSDSTAKGSPCSSDDDLRNT